MGTAKRTKEAKEYRKRNRANFECEKWEVEMALVVVPFVLGSVASSR
jgi:hypothetical protein